MDEIEAKTERAAKLRVEPLVALMAEERQKATFMAQLYSDSIKPGAPAAIRDLYAILMGWKVDRKEITLALNADEIAKRNLAAKKQLEEEASGELH